jgi:hypothetical protein
MTSQSVLLATLLATVSAVPLSAQDGTFTFNTGAGISTPLNPTSQYAGTSGNFQADAGVKISQRSSIIGEFLWSGLPPNNFVLHPISAPVGHINLYTLTANYRYGIDRIHGSRYGMYVIGGGGWYYRYASVDKNYVVPPGTVCQPIYGYWGYGCDPSGFVYSSTVAYKGTSVGGVNGGVGFTIGIGDSPWKFYTEARYHHAFNSAIATNIVPVTMGIRFN